MRNLSEQNIRKLGLSNQSYHITLPITLVRNLDWQKNKKLVVEQKGDTLVIKDWEK